MHRPSVVVLAGFLMVAAVVLTARYDLKYESRSTGYSIKCAQTSERTSATSSLVCIADLEKNAGDHQNNSEWFHKLIAWPEGITAWLLLFTLGGVTWQAWETRKAAESAKDSALAFVTSQGPQILVAAHGRPPDDLLHEPPYVQMELKNRGPTTARHLGYEWWIEVLPFNADGTDDFSDFTVAANHYIAEHRISVYPGQQPVIIHIPLGRTLSAHEREQILGLKRRVCVRVRVTYRDTFSSLSQYADFGYWVQEDGLGFLPKYNDSGVELEQT